MKSLSTILLVIFAAIVVTGCEQSSDPAAEVQQSQQKPAGQEMRQENVRDGKDLGGATEPIVD